jgi:hypothetical protein
MLRHKFKSLKTIMPATGAVIVVLAGVTGAFAAGGFSEPSETGGGSTSTQQAGAGHTSSSSTGGVVFSSPDVEYTSTTYASGNAVVKPGGANGAGVSVGDSTQIQVKGDATVEQGSESKTTVFSKNGGVLAKGRSDTMTTVTIGGQTYLVVEEVAKAAARSTPFGSSTATSVEQNVYGDGNGYSATTVNTDKSLRGSK